MATKSRSYALGLSIGTFWLVAASAAFSIGLLVNAGESVEKDAAIGVAIAAFAFLVLAFRQILAAARLPKEPRTEERRRTGRQFAWVVVLEVVAIMLANAVCFLTEHVSLLVPVDLIIVGIHFIPLARLFGVPRYTILGVAFCVISVATLLLVPADAHVGATVARFLISSLGCTVAAWLISAASLIELRRSLTTRRV